MLYFTNFDYHATTNNEISDTLIYSKYDLNNLPDSLVYMGKTF